MEGGEGRVVGKMKNGEEEKEWSFERGMKKTKNQ